MIPLLNNCIYQSYDLNDELDELIEQLRETGDIPFDSEAVPDFFSIAYNKSIDYYIEVFNKTKEFYNNIINIISNISLYNNSDIIDDKFGNLSGYGIIEGLYYLDPVCNESGCPYRIDFLKTKEEMKNNSTRRLSENPIRNEVKEMMKLLKEMRDINKNYSDYIFENMANPSRKLSTKYDYEIYKNYDSHSPPRDKNQVKVVISYLRSAIDEFNEKFYYYGKSIQTEIKNKFNNELEVLEEKYLKYLGILERIFSANNYRSIESIFTILMYRLNYYVNNMTDSINSLAEQYLDNINNIYFSQKVTGEMIANKIYNYYEGLDLLIQSKYKCFNETIFNTAYKIEEKESKLQNQSQLVSDLMLHTLKVETDIENEVKNESKKIFYVKEIDGKPIVINNKPTEIDLGKIEDDDKFNYILMKKKEKNNNQKKESENRGKKNEFMKKGETLKKQYENGHFKANLKIKINWENLLKSTLEANAGFEFKKHYDTPHKYPFILPQLPIAQIRLGYIFSVDYKIYFGLSLTFKITEEDGPKLDLIGVIKFDLEFKIDAVTEGGLYAEIANAYGGVSGTLLSADIAVRLFFLLLVNQVELFINLSINTFRFRVYVESTLKILIFKKKYVLVEKYYGRYIPLLNMYFYVKFDKQGQIMDSDKDIDFTLFKQKILVKNLVNIFIK